MPRSRDERPEYVVELEVHGVAVLSVRGDSEEDAGKRAEEKVRPVDVTDLYEVANVRVVKVSESVAATRPAPRSSSRKRAPKVGGRGRQA